MDTIISRNFSCHPPHSLALYSCGIQTVPIEPADVESTITKLDFLTSLTTTLQADPLSDWAASVNATPAPIPAIIQASFSSLGSIHLKLMDPKSALRAIVLSLTLSHPRAPEPEDYYNINIALRQLGYQQEATKLSWRLIDKALKRKGGEKRMFEKRLNVDIDTETVTLL